jgi:predicted acyltransferase
MLIIIGLDQLVASIAAIYPNSHFVQSVASQFSHAPWEGVRIYDLVFPLFLFISGIAMAFSLKRKVENSSKWEIATSLCKRAFVLFLLGILVSNHSLTLPCSDWRFASVLGLIGCSTAIAGISSLVLKSSRNLICLALLIICSVSLLQLNLGDFTLQHSFNATVDQILQPGRLHDNFSDPEGLLCIFSSVSLSIAGLITGRFLSNSSLSNFRKSILLAIIGCIVVSLGYALTPWYPAIKRLWTASFDIIACGWSLIILATFVFLFDVLHLKKLAYPFQIIGVNALAIYIGQELINFTDINERLFGGVASLFATGGHVFLAASLIGIKLVILHVMYRRNITIKV